MLFKKLIALSVATFVATSVPFAQAAQTPAPVRKKSPPPNARSVAESIAKPLLNQPARIVTIGGRKYVLAERYTKKGKLLSTLIVGEDFRELKVDEFGTGTASRWDLSKGNVTMRATSPYRGNFTNVEIEQRRAKDRVIYKLVYIPQTHRYRIWKWHREKYKLLAADNVIFGNMCSLTNVQNLDNFKRIIDTLNRSGKPIEQQSNLRCRLKAKSALMFAPNCTDDTSPLKDSMGDVVNGLADIMESGPVKTSASASGYASSSGGNYLSCLETHGMAAHSASIQQTLYDDLLGTDEMVTSAFINGNITQAEYDNLENPKPPNCDIDPNVLKRIRSSGFKNTANKGAYLFSCALPPGIYLGPGDADEFRGNFMPPAANSLFGNGQIILRLPKDKMPAAMGSAGYTAQSAYASTLLHEFVHSTGIGDENLTSNAEQCCAGANPSERATACKNLDDRLAVYEQQNRFNGVMSGNYFKSSPYEVNDYVNKRLNSSDDSDAFMLSYQRSVGGKIEADSAEYAMIKDSKGVTCASQATPSDECVKLQIKFAQTRLKTYTDEFLTEQCPAVMKAQNRSASDSARFCSDSKLKSLLEQSVTYDAKTAATEERNSATSLAILMDLAPQPADPGAKKDAKINPYANLFIPQTGLSGRVSGQAATAAITAPTGVTTNDTNAINSSPVSMVPKATIRSSAGRSTDGNGSGSATDVTSGAVPGAAGVGSNTRPDSLTGIRNSSVIADTLDKTATTLGNAVLPQANAAPASTTGASDTTQEPDIIVTAKSRGPKKTITAKTVSAASPMPMLPVASAGFSPTTASSADSSARPTLATYTASDTHAITPGALAASTSATTSPQLNAPKPAPIAPQQGNSLTAGAEPAPVQVLGSSGVAQQGIGQSAGSGGGDRNPSSAQSAPRIESKAEQSETNAPNFQTQQQLDNWLNLNYSRIEKTLRTTNMATQLIRLKTEVITQQQPRGVGCVPWRNCQPGVDRVFKYCPAQDRLLRVSRPCR